MVSNSEVGVWVDEDMVYPRLFGACNSMCKLWDGASDLFELCGLFPFNFFTLEDEEEEEEEEEHTRENGLFSVCTYITLFLLPLLIDL